MAPIYLLHVAACLLMTGVCLFVAMVHYPLMARVGREAWIDYERRHTAATGRLVAPLMLAELATAAWLSAAADGLVPAPGAWWWANIPGLALIWFITFAVNVPQHRRLARGWDGPTHRALVATHWVRTAIWSARSAALLWPLAAAATR